ncbi:hypothetical protein FC756_08550 [Lysinibacillus mangiferihumi]|uniref:Uncharacterized protein n=1 Tax=Lysinibacillus mangiferihumi TaxID=1130819 RepID=A0A4V5TM22_9BACI|nr:hypothetical protein [Lysinibacillus mangiferihumi]TKI70143.1 hypothetical protein FC756_08550 [Lysinibacillus mangiferihumi]
MIEQLQRAYTQGLKNLVFVDFENKNIIGSVVTLELELSKERACGQDLITAMNLHFSNEDYDSAQECAEVLVERIDYIKRLEGQIKEQRRNKLFDIANQLNKQGKIGEVVHFNANQSL